MEQLHNASVCLRRGIGCDKDVRQGYFRTGTTESGKISCGRGEQRGNQLVHKRGFYAKELLFFPYSYAKESTAALSEALTLWYQDRSGWGYVFSHPMAAPIGQTPRIVARKRAVFTLQLLRHGRGGAALRLCAYDVRSKI